MTNEEFEEFLSFFPEIEPPIILSTEEAYLYSRENKPFSEKMINKIILPIEKLKGVGEFTEYIPCFRLKKENSLIPIVYYKSELYKSEYHLLIFSEKGKLIDSKAIAGTFMNENELVTYLASIDEDNHIQVVIGSNEGDPQNYNPMNSQAISYDIAPDGKIITNH